MNCPNCGAPVNEKWKNCPYCETQIKKGAPDWSFGEIHYVTDPRINRKVESIIRVPIGTEMSGVDIRKDLAEKIVELLVKSEEIEFIKTRDIVRMEDVYIARLVVAIKEI